MRSNLVSVAEPSPEEFLVRLSSSSPVLVNKIISLFSVSKLNNKLLQCLELNQSGNSLSQHCFNHSRILAEATFLEGSNLLLPRYLEGKHKEEHLGSDLVLRDSTQALT